MFYFVLVKRYSIMDVSSAGFPDEVVFTYLSAYLLILSRY